ncbi:hypothetical protein HOE04_03230 [archaeon]|jgi:hypothetical protein|nr:hypothetical protein [archaeon]
MKLISRRTALATIATTATTLILPTYAHSEPSPRRSRRSKNTPNQTPSLTPKPNPTPEPISTPYQTPSLTTPTPTEPIEYHIIATRPVMKAKGLVHTVNAQFAFEKQTWENLPNGKDKQEFYNLIKDTPMQSTITPVLKGFPVIHPGPINHEDLLKELQEGAKQFIKYSNQELDQKYDNLKLDPELTFTKSNKKVLDKILKDNLTSPLTETISPYIGWDRKLYLFPPQSKIILTTNPYQSSIEIKVNTNPETNPPQYEPTQPSIISDPTQQEVFHTFFKFTILAKDDDVKKYHKENAKKWGPPIESPIDNFFRLYQERETA